MPESKQAEQFERPERPDLSGKSDQSVFASARQQAAWLASREISAVELLEMHWRQIERINPSVNAVITSDIEGARARAMEIDRQRAHGAPLGPFAGMPILIKDTHATRGMRSTSGSPIFADHVPDADTVAVARLREHGMIILGKTNVPEFGLGSHTFNTVFGATRNPWNLERSCGGSSGGAAVAVATGMIPFADGSDVGGSLRNPGNFNHVFGLRPSPGRVPVTPAAHLWSPLLTLGPIARTASDAAFLLAALAGSDPSDPLSITEDPTQFLAPLERDWKGVRVAFSATLGGLPVDRRVAEVLRSALPLLEALGCIVEEAEPDFHLADRAFEVSRAHLTAAKLGPLMAHSRSRLKATAIWNIEEGLKLTSEDLRRGEAASTASFNGMRAFLRDYEFLLAPVNQVPPFPISEEAVTEIEGTPMSSYIEWMRSCSRITASAHPAASVPLGFTAEGLPVGIQVVGRHRQEFSIFQFAHALEAANPLARRIPPIAL